MSNRKCAIYETLSPVREMKTQTGSDGLMTLSGIFGVCGVRNNNQRIYETANYASMVKRLQERIAQDGAVPGELEHPQTMNITTENISHKITNIQIDEKGVVTGTIKLLNTPKGKIAQAIVEGGLPLFVSSRATGSIDKEGHVTLENLATYDLVGSPGFSQARMHLNENQVCESLDENTTIIIDNTESENMDINEKRESESGVDVQELLERIENLESQASERLDVRRLAEGIQNWLENEYEPELIERIKSEINEAREDSEDSLDEDAVDSIVKDRIQEAAGVMGQRIQDWIINEYSPEVQNWIINEYSQGIQDWISDEYSGVLENWLNDNYKPEIQKEITEQVSENLSSQVKSNLNESKASKLQEISEMLSMLESAPVQKPTLGAKFINENTQSNEPEFIKNMPGNLRPSWNAASPEVKESVMRRARLFDFNSIDSIERFWERIDLSKTEPSKGIYEGLDSVLDARERAIRLALRSHRR